MWIALAKTHGFDHRSKQETKESRKPDDNKSLDVGKVVDRVLTFSAVTQS